MSRSGAADAAQPRAVPARQVVGSALALRNWRVAWRLIVLVAIPTALGLALAGLRVGGDMRSAGAYAQVDRLAVLGQQVTGLAQAMEQERADTATFIAAGRPAAGLLVLHRRYAVTDGWAARTRVLALQLGGGSPARTRASTATVLASIAELPGLRRQATQGKAPALAAIDGYSAAIANLLPVNDGIADLSGSPVLATSVRALGWLSEMKDQASQQQAILGVALTEGRLQPAALAALTAAEAQQASDLVSFRSLATPEESWAVTDTLRRPLAAAARAIERRATAAGDGTLAFGAHASRQWSAGMSYTVGWMRAAEQQLAGWIAAYAQAQQRSAMRSALITGGAALALLILVALVTLIIARSLVRPLRRLEAAALDVAGVRGVNAIYTSSFRRSHSLLERLLRLIDGLELGEDHPERLAALFQIDHVATRLRRNSDSTLVLAGHDAPHRRTEPVILVDVLRGAVSEIEQYDRVVVDAQQGVSVSGSAAAGTAHLLAELLDNATAFSPKTATVTMSGHRVRGGGALITITDGGPGMPEEQLTELNWRLAHPDLADLTDAPHLGLFAVAQLAARHGITVALGPSPGGGTTAEVRLPGTLIEPDAKPAGRPGAAGEALRAGAGGGAAAAAADPLRPAPRYSAGPEFAASPQAASPQAAPPQAASPGAVPLRLGAPLPAPTPSAPLAGTGPEPAGTDQGGALPIFQSVESGYFRRYTQGRQTPAGLPQRIPRADPGPGTAADPGTGHVPAADSAQIALARLASFQRGSRRARAVTRTDRDAKPSSRDA
jgi:signal transduction histidine kinase